MLLKYGMTDVHLCLLNDIRLVLLVFHSVQELLSSERTPTLAVTLPAYEACLKTLQDVVEQDVFPWLNHAIKSAIEKIEKYVKIARKNHVYGIAMCKCYSLSLYCISSALVINPSCKKEWMTVHWSEPEVDTCMKVIRKTVCGRILIIHKSLILVQMIAYRKKELVEQQSANPSHPEPAITSFPVSPPHSPTPSQSTLSPITTLTAHQRLHSGFSRLDNLSELISSSMGRSFSRQQVVAATSPATSASEEIESQAARDVDMELNLYLSHPRVSSQISGYDILAFWQVSVSIYLKST
jgi:hypothetical protein